MEDNSSTDSPSFFSKYSSKKSEMYDVSKSVLKDKIKFILKKHLSAIELLYTDESNDRIHVELHSPPVQFGHFNEIGEIELKIDEIENNKSKLTYFIQLFRDFRYTIFLIFFLAMELPVIIIHLITFSIDLQNYISYTTLKYLQALPIFLTFHIIFILVIPIIQLLLRKYAFKKINESIKWFRLYLREELDNKEEEF